MSTLVRISDDSLAKACGAEELVCAFEKVGCTVERRSSWGMAWLEPLVEIDGVGFGPATTEDVARYSMERVTKVSARLSSTLLSPHNSD